MFQLKAKILSHKEIAPDCFLMELRAPAIARMSQPGQFIHLQVDGSDSSFLRRPFSVHRIRPRSVELLYQRKGKGTGLLAQRKEGEVLDLIGPLGNGFDLTALPPGERIVLIGGGIGIAPLLTLAEKLLEQNPDKDKLFFFLGAHSKALILKEKEIRALGINCFLSTDDGTCGNKGMITGLFENRLKEWRRNPGMVFACGPKAMLKVLGDLSRKYEFSCQISLEENMACGIGVCLGCVVAVKSSQGTTYKRVCRDGPIFKAREVVFD